MASSFTWIVGSGIWSVAADWANLTTSTSPATSPPGAADAATITGPSIPAAYIVGGPGSATQLTLNGFLGLTGAITTGTLALGSGTVDLAAGAALDTGAAALAGVTVEANGSGALFKATGTATDSGFGGDLLAAVDGGTVWLAGLTDPSVQFVDDPTGVIEIGSAGGAAAGELTVDAGATFSGGGNFGMPVVDNGSIIGTGNLGFSGLSGSGLVEVAPFEAVRFYDQVVAGPTVAFEAASGTISISNKGFDATISGFAAGATISVGSALTTASFAGGVLTLANGGTVVATPTLEGSYTGSTFLVLPVNAAPGSSVVVLATNSAGSVTAAPAGTGSADTYVWTSTTGGAWANVANWTDQSVGTTVAAPGSNDIVTIAGPISGAYQVVTGDGDASSLTLSTGNDALAGSFTVGTLAVGNAFSVGGGTVDLLAGAVVDAGTAAIGGHAVVGGAGASLAVTGTMTLGNAIGASGTVSVFDGGAVTAAAVVLGGFGSGFGVDGASSAVIGGGAPTAGAITVGAGGTLSGVGIVAGAVIDDGSILASGNGFSLGFPQPLLLEGNVSGTGELAIYTGQELQTQGTVDAGVTVALLGTHAIFSSSTAMLAPITGFALTDVLQSSFFTFDSLTANTVSGGVDIVVAEAGGTALATYDLKGSFTGDSFLDDGAGIVLAAGTLQTSPAAAAGAGVASDAMVWNALGGSWNTAANWNDVTAGGGAASGAPGITNSVSIGDPAGDSGAWQVISGAGNAAAVTLDGNIALSGTFDFTALLVQSNASLASVGTLEVVSGGTVQAASASITSTALVSGSDAALSVGGTLTLGGTATTSVSLTVNDGGVIVTQALALAANNFINIGVDATGAIEVGTAHDSIVGAMVVDPGVTVSGGALGIGGNLVNHGTVAIGDSGVLSLSGVVSGDGVLQLASEDSVELGGTIAAGQTIAFDGTQDGLSVSGGTIEGTIAGFQPGDEIQIYGTNSAAPFTDASWSDGTLSLTNDGAPAGTLLLSGNYVGDSFLVNVADGGSTITLASQEIACFAAGTRIATTRGAIAVEALQVGDRVVTARGGARPIVWLGHRRVDCRRHPRPHDVLPVRVRAGAFGDGRPMRDLVLSPDHAVYTGGCLIPVRYLVNGRSIVQETVADITYHHVELDAHDVMLAEGLPCESYLDTGNRGAFANGSSAGDGEGAAPITLHADFARGVWSAQACADLVLDGARLRDAKTRLLQRAVALGHAMTDDAGLRVMVDGRAWPAEIDGRTWRIPLPPTARSVRLVSGVWVPMHMRADEEDSRALGVAIGALRCDGAAIGLDDPRLSSGWHAVESADDRPDWRWTDGDAGLALAGVRELTFDVVMTGCYWEAPYRDMAAQAARSAAF